MSEDISLVLLDMVILVNENVYAFFVRAKEPVKHTRKVVW